MCGSRYFVLSSLVLYKLLVASGGLSCGENRPQLPHSRTIYSKSSICAPEQWQKQTKSSSSSLFVCISFPPRKRALLKYSATSKWRVTLTRLFSLMSSSSNPSMIHLLQMGHPSEQLLVKEFGWGERGGVGMLNNLRCENKSAERL